MLTKRQKQVLDFIKFFTGKKGYAPSLEEIKKHLRLSSVSTAHHHVKSLEEAGYLKKEENSPRSIDVYESQSMIQIPILGRISAGQPMLAVEDKEIISIPQTNLRNDIQNLYALKVVGQSMIDENINNGDVVIVRSQQTAEDGQKVVALINNEEVTLKKIYREKTQIRLQPANPAYSPIFVDPKKLIIQGVVIDIIKNLTSEPFSLQNSHPVLNGVLDKTKEDIIRENQIFCGDAIELLDRVKKNSIDLVLSDIPYGISLDEWDVLHANTNSALLGQSPAQIGKKAFKRRGKPINGWSSADRNILKEYQQWCYSWGTKLFPVLKEGGSLFIFGARRTLHRAIIALEDSGFLLRDILAWEKPSAHHRAQEISNIFLKRGMEKEAEKWAGWKLGNLAPKYEPVAWLFKPYKLTITDNVLKNNLGAMNIEACLVDGKSPTNMLKFGFANGENGLHEAQKPVSLLEYLIKLVTTEDQVVLDPFMGSGSTIVAAKGLKRKYIGFDISKDYWNIASRRLSGASIARSEVVENNFSQTSLL